MRTVGETMEVYLGEPEVGRIREALTALLTHVTEARGKKPRVEEWEVNSYGQRATWVYEEFAGGSVGTVIMGGKELRVYPA